MTDSTHYVAHIKIERVVKTTISGQPKRDVADTTNLTVKASSLTTLKEKIAAHTSLLDDEDI